MNLNQEYLTGSIIASRSGQSPLNRPASHYPGRHSSPTKAKLIGPCAKAKPSPTEFQNVGVTLVAVLLLHRGPINVTRLVVAVVVAPFNGMFRGWAATHIGDEVFEYQPSLANRDTASTVVPVSGSVWVLASRQHAYPYRMQRVIRHSVCGVPAYRRIAFKAPARLGVSGSEIVRLYDDDDATAAAAPKSTTKAAIRLSEHADVIKNCELSEGLSSEVLKILASGHRAGDKFGRHSIDPLSALFSEADPCRDRLCAFNSSETHAMNKEKRCEKAGV